MRTVRTVVEDRTLEENFYCGVGKMHVGHSDAINYQWDKIGSG